MISRFMDHPSSARESAFLTFLYKNLDKTFSFSKAKPAEICNFYNNVESVWDHIVKINKCFKLDRKTQYFVTCGAADKNDAPIESIAKYDFFLNHRLE